jgi:isopenicillin-N epimerase
MPKMLKDLFLLDPQVIFLNHGSFGACPRQVFEKYQDWQRQLEYQPVQFLGVELDNNLFQSRQELGNYLHAPARDLVYIPNATHGVNIVARSLVLKPGDEILTTDHEYGACNYTWEYICNKTGAIYKHQAIHLPINSAEEIIDQLWQGVTLQTKLIFFSHITSPTSLVVPVKEICTRARQAGIISLIDGAHAPGQLPIDLADLQPDFYVGNCHKWMLSPKGAGFLYAKPEMQPLIEPLIVSWGYPSTFSTPRESRFVDLLQWSGTKDPAAMLSVPAAIEFMEANHWDEVGTKCHEMLGRAMDTIHVLTGLAPLYGSNSELYRQMGTIPIPRVRDLNDLKSHLYNEYKIEVPCLEWNGHHYIRVSVQGYNSQDDLEKLIFALHQILPELGVDP